MKPASAETMSGPLLAAATVFVAADDVARIREALSADRVEVIQTGELAEAVKLHVPVILLDADGSRDWARSVRQVVEMRPTACVVVLARVADNHMWVQALSQGAHDLLPKPIVPSEIRAAVLGAMQRTRLRSAATG